MLLDDLVRAVLIADAPEHKDGGLLIFFILRLEHFLQMVLHLWEDVEIAAEKLQCERARLTERHIRLLIILVFFVSLVVIVFEYVCHLLGLEVLLVLRLRRNVGNTIGLSHDAAFE